MITIEYFHNPVCPYCPAAMKLVRNVISGLKDVEYKEIDTYTEEGHVT
jgi:glutaredoxin